MLLSLSVRPRVRAFYSASYFRRIFIMTITSVSHALSNCEFIILVAGFKVKDLQPERIVRWLTKQYQQAIVDVRLRPQCATAPLTLYTSLT